VVNGRLSPALVKCWLNFLLPLPAYNPPVTEPDPPTQTEPGSTAATTPHAWRSPAAIAWFARVTLVFLTADLGLKYWAFNNVAGVPIRLEVGPRDMADDAVFMGRRDKTPKDKQSMKRADFLANVANLLEEMQVNLFERAKALRSDNTRTVDDRDEFEAFFKQPAVGENQPVPIHGGFALAHWCGDAEVENQINDDLGVTIRCIPNKGELPDCDERGTCIFTGQGSTKRGVFAKAY